MRENLGKAKKQKNDEFYTSYEVIKKEIDNYWSFLENKKIWCNCNDNNSEFKRYFQEILENKEHNFEIKYTSYQLIPNDKTNFKEIELGKCIDFLQDGKIIKTEKMWVDSEGYCKGDFRAKEQSDLWDWADIVITNPPFSLFRNYFDMCLKKNKKMLIIGGQNCIGYKNVFELIQNNKLWLGINKPNKLIEIVNGEKKLMDNSKTNLPNCLSWFTNIPIERNFKEIELVEWENEKFPKYDNLDAYDTMWFYGNKRFGKCQIPKTNKILGVPITYLFKHNPNQFEIVGFRKGNDGKDVTINGKDVFSRIFIKSKKFYQ